MKWKKIMSDARAIVINYIWVWIISSLKELMEVIFCVPVLRIFDIEIMIYHKFYTCTCISSIKLEENSHKTLTFSANIIPRIIFTSWLIWKHCLVFESRVFIATTSNGINSYDFTFHEFVNHTYMCETILSSSSLNKF